jgi:hypothetical protein
MSHAQQTHQALLKVAQGADHAQVVWARVKGYPSW